MWLVATMWYTADINISVIAGSSIGEHCSKGNLVSKSKITTCYRHKKMTMFFVVYNVKYSIMTLTVLGILKKFSHNRSSSIMF